MPMATSNRLLPVLGIGVLALLMVVVSRSTDEPDTGDPMLASVPSAPAPDADSPADTIKTLTANVADMNAQVQALRQDNAALRRENQALDASRAQIEENVASRLRREWLAREQAAEGRAQRDDETVRALSERIEALSASVTAVQDASLGTDIPVGLGYDGIDAAGPAPAVQWIAPLDASTDAAEAPGILDRAGQTAGGYLHRADHTTRDLAAQTRQQVDALHSRPVYTVPRNATLIGATAMTALVGRIPIQGQVRDPMPFKIITGPDNLAANGLRVPGVQGMVWSGTAVGDWTLSCVTGRLESVTFVFDDGTIRTLASDVRAGARDLNGQGGADRPLGWISDEQGIPCIAGTRKTNAASFLAQRIGIQAVQAAAAAAAAAETTSVVGDLGTVTDSVTGDVGTFVLGRTVAGGSDEVAKWLLERQSQSFDAVFVPPGQAVAIHVDHELAIDFEPDGRKLQHAQTPANPGHARLD